MTNTTNKPARRLKNDIILIVALFLIAAIGMVYLFMFRKSGDTARVTIDGNLYGVYPLSEDLSLDIYTGKDNTQHNRLIIKEGKAYIEAATCPDGICAAHSKIYRNGESIVCLPHKVVVTVFTQETDDAPDIVAMACAYAE